MQFKLISVDDLQEIISSTIMNFNGPLPELKKNLFLPLNEQMFEEFKKKPISKEEVARLIAKDEQKATQHLIRVKDSWNIQEKDILSAIKKRTGLEISTQDITCSINLYTGNGFYGYNNITLGIVDNNSEVDVMVIAHELFHIFYWRKVRELGLSKGELGKEPFWEWAICEATAFMLQNDLKRFWPNIPLSLYPDTTDTYKIGISFWKKLTFEQYLIKSYKVFKNEIK